MVYGREIEVLRDDTIEILNKIVRMDKHYVKQIFYDSGLIIFLINLIFSSKFKHIATDLQLRVDYTILVLKCEHNCDENKVLSSYIPPLFFAEINEKMVTTYDAEPEFVKIQKFLEDFEKSSFENVFVKWNKEMREKSHNNIRQLCKQIR